MNYLILNIKLNIKMEQFKYIEDNIKINKKNTKRIILSDKNVENFLNNKNKKIPDEYNINLLLEQYNLHKTYVIKRKETMNKLKIKFRLPYIPEDISENIIKFILHKNKDNSIWNCKTGDLYSTINGKQECKCFTSTGPISFTPSSDWDEIYFLDATDWINDNFILYKTTLKKSSIQWNNIKVNKKQTFKEQCDQKRRPRLTWKELYKQIKDYTILIFNGYIFDLKYN
jgi:hypothetical protein